MKKILLIITIIILTISTIKPEKVIIPKNSIRFRVIANSNDEYDQNIKKVVANNLSTELSTITSNSTSIEESRNKIEQNIPVFDEIINHTLESAKYNKKYTINYGVNYFPKKEYKGLTYEEGEYESLVVTLGDGLGENFWCVLFPPLCLLEGDENNTNEVEYTSFIKEIIDKYL